MPKVWTVIDGSRGGHGDLRLEPAMIDRASPSEYLTKREYAADRLREMIMVGDLAAGAQVRQQAIAEVLGISATPVREAIWQLESEGYLESTAHVGFRVAQPRPEWFPEVFDLRLDLEGRLARIAAMVIEDGEIQALRRFNEEFRQAILAQERREVRRANYRLHRAMWAFARQPVTATIAASLWAKFPRTALDQVEVRGPQSAEEHHKLIEAIAARDPAGAETAMRHHISAAHGDWRSPKL